MKETNSLEIKNLSITLILRTRFLIDRGQLTGKPQKKFCPAADEQTANWNRTNAHKLFYLIFFHWISSRRSGATKNWITFHIIMSEYVVHLSSTSSPWTVSWLTMPLLSFCTILRPSLLYYNIISNMVSIYSLRQPIFVREPSTNLVSKYNRILSFRTGLWEGRN